MSAQATLEQVLAIGGGSPVRVGVALEAGITRGAIRAAIISGQLTQPSRGTIAPAALGDSTPVDLLLERCRAIQARRPRLVFSHITAAVIDGLPVLRAEFERLYAWDPSPRPIDGVRNRRRELPEELVTEVAGVRITHPLCTAIDLARELHLPSALITLDAVMRATAIAYNSVDRRPDHRRVECHIAVQWAFDQLAAVAASLHGSKGARSARHALELASPRAESPAESFSRGHMLLAGIVPLELQHRVFDADGVERRLDFLLAPGLAGEVDGMVKYDGEGAARQLREEKNRDLLLERVDVRTLRWTGIEVFRDPATVIRLVGRTIAQHRAARARHSA
jgi:hypothetical protein